MAKWEAIYTSRYCSLPICDCGLEKKVMKEHKLYHILDRTKYYEGRCDAESRTCSDEPLDVSEEKRKHQKKLDAEECQAYMPLFLEKISPSELFLENDMRITDTVWRTAQRSTLTNMLPLRPRPVKKKESDWGSYQDMSREYTTEPAGAEKYRSMMTRFRDEMLISKIPNFREEVVIDNMK